MAAAGPQELPDGLDRARHSDLAGRRHHVVVHRLVAAAIAALPVVALLNVFGQRASTSTAAGPAATLAVHAPARLRGGLIYQTRFTVTARRAIKDLDIVLSPGWFDGLSVNAIEPSPSQEGSRDGNIALSYGPLDAGKRLISFVYWQVNPTTVADREVNADVYDGATLLAHVHRDLTVLP